MNRKQRDRIRVGSFGTREAIALAGEVISTAKEETRLPTSIARSLKKVKPLHEELVDLTQAQIVLDDSSGESRDAFRRNLTCWTSLRNCLKAWMALPEDEHPEQRELAKKLELALFANRPKLAQLGYKQAWVEADARLGRIDQDELEDSIRRLGGGPFLESIRGAHRASGQLFGITKKAAPKKVEREAKALIAELRDALNDYVVVVQGYGLSGEPAAAELAARLLAPIAVRRSRPKKQSAPSAQPAPQPAPASPTPAVPAVPVSE